MKILGLDIDGVLNSGKFLKESNQEDSEGCVLDPSKVKIISNVLERDPEVLIIMNSSWNSTFTLDQYKDLFLKVDPNFPVDRIIDQTSSDMAKPEALKKWLSYNDVENFLCIDDDTLFDLDSPYSEYQLKTSFYVGLKPEFEEMILEALTEKFNP